eukprot:gnl/MRDRNA2_/MRDRNA2_54564_c0_seq1.p1 gnl/MRDRNA2_/MRDRNA2_54564_c0~~gnl/MRDRNA2_/MRDRNA2_54564_c0_seq1.p1  ORF type:complete len:666 (+),score=91.41 gnl/MRDRNA2_/MRDRNA2_54564_c0_seq1:166-2163(+)
MTTLARNHIFTFSSLCCLLLIILMLYFAKAALQVSSQWRLKLFDRLFVKDGNQKFHQKRVQDSSQGSGNASRVGHNLSSRSKDGSVRADLKNTSVKWMQGVKNKTSTTMSDSPHQSLQTTSLKPTWMQDADNNSRTKLSDSPHQSPPTTSLKQTWMQGAENNTSTKLSDSPHQSPPTTSSQPTPEEAKVKLDVEAKGVAICISCQLRNADTLSVNFADHVLKPLGASTNVTIFWVMDISEIVPHAELIYKAWNRTYVPIKVPVQERHGDDLWAQIQDASASSGNWSINFKTFQEGQMLIREYFKHHCYIAITEEERRRRHKYDWWIHTRSDMHWLADHPSLPLLNPEFIWIPRGMDWGGINDRHAAVPRRHVHGYFQTWSDLLARHFRSFLTSIVAQFYTKNFINSERLLLLHLIFNASVIGRFSSIAAIQCCFTNCTSTKSGQAGRPSLLWDNEGYARAKSEGKILPCKMYGHKYEEEFQVASANAHQLQQGKKWTRTAFASHDSSLDVPMDIVTAIQNVGSLLGCDGLTALMHILSQHREALKNVTQGIRKNASSALSAAVHAREAASFIYEQLSKPTREIKMQKLMVQWALRTQQMKALIPLAQAKSNSWKQMSEILINAEAVKKQAEQTILIINQQRQNPSLPLVPPNSPQPQCLIAFGCI